MSPQYRELLLGEEFADLLRDPIPAADEFIDTAALGDALIFNLRAQLAQYADYLERATRQRMALVNRNLAGNEAGNLDSEQFITAVAALEEERIALTGKIVGPARAAEAAKIKCEILYPLLSESHATDLKNCRDELVKTVDELKRTLAVNMALVENGQKIIHTTFGIMTSVVGRTKMDNMKTYTSKGSVQVGRMQIRNLINRSV